MADLARIESQQISTPIPEIGIGFGTEKAKVEAAGAVQLGQTVATLSDQVVQVLGQDEAKRGADEAAQIIQKDGSGNLMAPSSFTPPGFKSRAYAVAYENQARALYSTAMMQQVNEAGQLAVTKFPTDPDAVARDMGKKKDQLLMGLDPRLMPMAVERINAATSQYTSTALNNRAVEDNKVLNDQTNLAWNTYIENTSNRGRALVGMTADDAMANVALDNLELQQAKDLAHSAGWSPNRIKQFEQKAKVKAITAAAVKDLETSGFIKRDEQSGVQYFNAEGVAQATAAADKWASKFPGYAVEIRAELRQAVSQGAQRSQLYLQQQDINNQNEANRTKVRMLPDLTRTDQPSEYDIHRINALKKDIVLDPTINAVSKFQQLAVMDQALGKTTTMTQQYLQREIVQNAAVIDDKSATPAQRDYAVQAQGRLLAQAQTMPPEVLTPALQSHAEGSIRRFSQRQISSDIAQSAYDASQGWRPPEAVRDMVKEWTKNGYVGPDGFMTYDQTQTMLANSEKAWASQKVHRDNIAASNEAWRNGGVIANAEQTKSWAAADPFEKNVLGGQKFVGTPDQFKAGAARLATTGVFEPVIKEWINDNFGQTGDPSTVSAVQGFYRAAVETLKARPGYQADKAHEQIINAMGAAGARVSSSMKYTPDEYVKRLQSEGTSRTGQAGGPEKQNIEVVNKALDTTLSQIGQKIHSSGFLSPFGTTYAEPGTDLGTAPAASALAGTIPTPAANESLMGRIESTIYGRDIKSVRIDDSNLRGLLVEYGTNDLQTNGAAHTTAGVNAPLRSASLSLEKMRAYLEVVEDPNDKTQGILQLRSGNRIVADVMGWKGRASDEQQAAYVHGAYQVMRGDEPAAVGYDAGSGRMETRLDYNGVPYVSMVARFNGTVVELGQMAIDDPTLTGFGKAVTKEVSRHMRETLGDDYQKLTPVQQSNLTGNWHQHILNGVKSVGIAAVDELVRPHITKSLIEAAGRPDILGQSMQKAGMTTPQTRIGAAVSEATTELRAGRDQWLKDRLEAIKKAAEAANKQR